MRRHVQSDTAIAMRQKREQAEELPRAPRCMNQRAAAAKGWLQQEHTMRVSPAQRMEAGWRAGLPKDGGMQVIVPGCGGPKGGRQMRLHQIAADGFVEQQLSGLIGGRDSGTIPQRARMNGRMCASGPVRSPDVSVRRPLRGGVRGWSVGLHLPLMRSSH